MRRVRCRGPTNTTNAELVPLPAVCSPQRTWWCWTKSDRLGMPLSEQITNYGKWCIRPDTQLLWPQEHVDQWSLYPPSQRWCLCLWVLIIYYATSSIDKPCVSSQTWISPSWSARWILAVSFCRSLQKTFSGRGDFTCCGRLSFFFHILFTTYLSPPPIGRQLHRHPGRISVKNVMSM